MSARTQSLAVTIASITLLAFSWRTAHAALTINSGFVHATATAICGNASQTTTPVDINLTSTGGGNSASANAFDAASGFPSQSSFINGGVTRTGSFLSFSGSGSVTGGPPGTSSSASVNGTVTFTIDVTQDYTATNSPPSPFPNPDYFFQGGTLFNSSNTALANFGGQTVTLTPGQYHIDWSMSTARQAGSGGSGSGNLALTPVPEPATLGLLSIAPVLLRRRRSTPHNHLAH